MRQRPGCARQAATPEPDGPGAFPLFSEPEGLEVRHKIGSARSGLHFLVDLDYLAVLRNVERPAQGEIARFVEHSEGPGCRLARITQNRVVQ